MDSSYNALLHLKHNPPEIVLIHDAVRPFLSQRIVNDSIGAARKYGAADVAVKTNDTIVEANK